MLWSKFENLSSPSFVSSGGNSSNFCSASLVSASSKSSQLKD